MEVRYQYEKVPMFLTLLCPLTFGLEMKLGLGGSVPKDGAIGFFWQHQIQNVSSYYLFPLPSFTPLNPLFLFPRVAFPLKIIITWALSLRLQLLGKLVPGSFLSHSWASRILLYTPIWIASPLLPVNLNLTLSSR